MTVHSRRTRSIRQARFIRATGTERPVPAFHAQHGFPGRKPARTHGTGADAPAPEMRCAKLKRLLALSPCSTNKL
ncbi:hypothetical protein ACT6QH_11255 [Xanthobacter sp. TB0139]|uniref:hypothetical protein n=1 Tax=Xanthobacter sp. TB0139 TaxID=3459178 RepID=UPI004039E656